MIYGYARVSTQGQDLSLQRQELADAGAQLILAEKFTGTKRDRPELNRLMGLVQSGDKIIVAKLDRIARSVADGVAIIDELVSRGVTIEVLNMGKFDSSPSGKLLRSIMFAFAEFERDMIVERTSEGKRVAREKPGYHEGRPAVDAKTIERIKQGIGWQELGISRATWYRYRSA